MTPYRIEFRPAALRTLRKLDPQIGGRIRGAIAMLAQNPRPPAAIALKDRPGLRVRVGDYRIIFAVHTQPDNEGVLKVAVLAPGHRRDIYER